MKRVGNKLIWDEKDIEYLSNNYHKETLVELAKNLNVSKQTIARKSNELGLCKRTIEDMVKANYGIEDLNSYLQKAHWEEMLTVQAISKKLGVSRKSLYEAMARYNIPARTFSEAIKIYWDNASEEQKKKQCAAAHKKHKELAREGKHPFQKMWKEKPEEMRRLCAENALKMCKNRKRNGMTGRTGPKHHNWNPKMTKAKRIKFRKTEEHYAWVRAVYEKDNYVCQACGYDKGGTLNAHHLESYANCEEKRMDVSNGITLCKACHVDFHNIYGYGENTAEQFYEYRNKQLEL